MKRRLLILASTIWIAGQSWAAPVDLVEVTAAEINCLFSPTCTLQYSNTLSPFTLPGTTGSGVLQTRVFAGQAGSEGAGWYGYEYRIDLTGVTATNNTPPCLTNSVRCFTNRVSVTTNRVTCRTNATGVSNLLVCVTNVFPGTNFTFCLTNVFPATNVTRCLTNAAGGITCFTNFFPGSNMMACVTNRIPPRTNILCFTNRVMASNIVVCTTNTVTTFTNRVTCFTNSIPCPGRTPCIDSLRLPFSQAGTIPDNGTGEVATVQVYIVSAGGLGTIAPAFAQRTGNEIQLEFAPPICPGTSSFFVGILSTNPPADIRARLGLTSDANLVLAARGPARGTGTPPIECDLGPLAAAIEELSLRDIVAPNNNARAGRQRALQEMVEAAGDAAEAGQLHNVMEAITEIVKKVSAKKNSWLTADAAARLDPILDELVSCLDQADQNGNQDEDDDDEDDGDKDKDNGQNGNGGNNGNKGRGRGHNK